MRVTVPVDVEIPAPVINIQMPQNAPLMCDIKRAAELMGLSPTTLRQLRRKYRDFPVKKVGRGLLFLMPDLYAWFRDFPGDIETE